LKSTSCKALAQEVLELCLAGTPPKELPRALASETCGPHLFGILAEGLGDRFEPRLCDDYARLFAQAISYAREGYPPPMLISRYERVRQVRPAVGKPHRIFVLSRVTLGAEVAVTSVLLAAAKKRFPHAELILVGPKKNYELFAGDSHIRHVPIEYRRGSLRERLEVWEPLVETLSDPFSLVLDPDSRLTQLGLLPVTSWERYHLFESRSYGGDSDRSLPDLASEWCIKTLGVVGARPYVALGPSAPRGNHISVSLGVGDNPAKRLPDPFEEELLKLLATTGRPIVVDCGAGGEEGERVRHAVQRSGVDASYWEGSFAGFASIIAASSLYAGYDSAGQHVAAATGVPLISIFAGFPVERLFYRWRPKGNVIRVDEPDVPETLARVADALQQITSSPAPGA
jgi:ADP-heptose:LPS heptosyltransferase